MLRRSEPGTQAPFHEGVGQSVLFLQPQDVQVLTQVWQLRFCGEPSDEQVLHEQCREH